MQNKLSFAKGTRIKKGNKIGDVGGTPNYGIHVHIGMSENPSLSSFFTAEFDGKHNPDNFRKKVNISGIQMENTFGYGSYDAEYYPNSNHNGIDDGNVSEGSDITYDCDIEVVECGYHVNDSGNGGFGNYIIFKEVEVKISYDVFGCINQHGVWVYVYAQKYENDKIVINKFDTADSYHDCNIRYYPEEIDNKWKFIICTEDTMFYKDKELTKAWYDDNGEAKTILKGQVLIAQYFGKIYR